jgi:hypothetical protein
MTPTSQEHHMTTTDTEPTRWRKKPVELPHPEAFA